MSRVFSLFTRVMDSRLRGNDGFAASGEKLRADYTFCDTLARGDDELIFGGEMPTAYPATFSNVQTRGTCAFVAALVLAACTTKTPEPDWRANAASALASFSDAYLKGDSRAADTEFRRARAEMTSTGRFDLVAHAELYRCAAQVAVLELTDCPGFAPLAQDATPTERAYAAYLAGRWNGLDASLLPVQHRAVIAAGDTPKLAAIADPLSRQVAAGALMAAGRITPADIGAAVDNASAQGWRRPLLTWLGVLLKRAQDAGDTQEAERLQRRIALASQ